MKLRPHGIFHIQNENATHITFMHTATSEECKVLKSSFTNSPEGAEEEYWLATFARWNNDYYVSGLCFPSPYRGVEIDNFNLQMQQAVQKHFPAYRETIIKTALDFRDKAFRYFGKDLVAFPSGKELQKKLDSFNEWYFKNVSVTSSLDAKEKPAKIPVQTALMDAKDIALFIPPADSFEFIWIHKTLLHTLQMAAPDMANRQEIENVIDALLSKGISKDYWLYIKKEYDLPGLSFFLQCAVDNARDFEALLRIYKPNDFSAAKLPRFRTYTSEKVSHAEAKKILA